VPPELSRGSAIKMLNADASIGTDAPREQFFFEKKNQKTFILFRARMLESAKSTHKAKVFCFFFSKKKYLLAPPVCQSLRRLSANFRLCQQNGAIMIRLQKR
jgi:hypothetical protein